MTSDGRFPQTVRMTDGEGLKVGEEVKDADLGSWTRRLTSRTRISEWAESRYFDQPRLHPSAVGPRGDLRSPIPTPQLAQSLADRGLALVERVNGRAHDPSHRVGRTAETTFD